jgi:hypothetical protein
MTQYIQSYTLRKLGLRIYLSPNLCCWLRKSRLSLSVDSLSFKQHCKHSALTQSTKRLTMRWLRKSRKSLSVGSVWKEWLRVFCLCTFWDPKFFIGRFKCGKQQQRQRQRKQQQCQRCERYATWKKEEEKVRAALMGQWDKISRHLGCITQISRTQKAASIVKSSIEYI